MTRTEALVEAARRWGASFARVKHSHWFDHLAGCRLHEYQVGEHSAQGFAIYGRSPVGWVEAFQDADRRNKEDMR